LKLYINGDSHAAAAEAVNVHSFAEDDGRYFFLGRAPHPENLAVSWGTTLARTLKATMHNDSEAASSNHRILRTTKDWMERNQNWLPETVMIIQWSTWERQEWLIDGVYYQINASGIDHVPATHQQRYKDFVTSVDWQSCTQYWHDAIWQFHLDLLANGTRHIFFNGNNHFGDIPEHDRQDWGYHYLDPYAPENTYDSWLKSHGHSTVSPESWHFGPEAHTAWARFMLQYGMLNKIWS
jgi:hypothetical protein